jgi:putative pyruvate formate lyase activating enzyme
MLELQTSGCHNINLVTPTHVMPQILISLELAIKKGLRIPLVYNTSGYELPEIIRLLSGIIDIYLADMRYADNAAAIKYSAAPDYPKFNQASLKIMQQQVGPAKFNPDGTMEKGLIIRHLVLPNNASGTDKIMRFISEELSPDTYISLMSQYYPYYCAADFPEINRRLKPEEYLAAEKTMQRYGLANGWTQESFGLERFAGTNIKPAFPDENPE